MKKNGYIDIVMGLQWGDEGKGKIVHFLAKDYDLGVRPHGGPNAGHSIIINGETVVLNSIPCTIFELPSLCGAGMVLNPVLLVEEIEKVKKYGGDIAKNLYLSNEATLILPIHILEDKAEEFKKGKDKIGSTLQGISPAYRDKYGREALRIEDMFSGDFAERLQKITDKHKVYIRDFLGYPLDEESEINIPNQKFLTAVEELKKYESHCVACAPFVNMYLANNARILSEGAQATMLDVAFGTYPFVTSSRTIASAVPGELGVGAQYVRKVFGVMKAYTTRVGNGPFPTKISGGIEERLRELGHEYGARTKRPRDVGWLDLVLLRYAIDINGVTDLVITKGDILDEFDPISVCTKYKLNDQIKENLDFNLARVGAIEPIYENFAGWGSVGKLVMLKNYANAPENARKYFEFLQTSLGVPIYMISVGPGKEEIILL